MFFVPQGPDFQWVFSNTLNTQPASFYGTSITPSTSGSYGSWAQVATAANMAQDTYGVYICFNSGNTSGAVRNILCEMGVDNGGGTSYQSVIPYLMAGNAAAYNSGIWYYFPLYIKSGSTVAFRAMSNSATALRVSVYFYGQPRRPEAVRAGSYVDAYGFNTGTRAGVSVNPGTTSEGSWATIDITSRSYWWWQAGLNINNATMNSASIHLDIAAGDPVNRKILFENQPWTSTTSETISCIPQTMNAYNNVAPNQVLFARAQQLGSVTSGTTVIIYGLGG